MQASFWRKRGRAKDADKDADVGVAKEFDSSTYAAKKVPSLSSADCLLQLDWPIPHVASMFHGWLVVAFRSMSLKFASTFIRRPGCGVPDRA